MRRILEYLNVRCCPPCTSVLVPHWSHSLPPSAGDSSLVSVDLSKATKLRDVAFRAGSSTILWIITAHQTITSEHRDLQQITIRTPYSFSRIGADYDVRQTVGGAKHSQWLALDLLLAQLCESCSIRTKILSTAPVMGGNRRASV